MSDSSHRRFEGRFYALDQFDRHLCLKPPLGLLLCLLLIGRDLLFAIVSTAGSMKGPGVDMSSLLAQHHRWVFLAGLLPAMCVVWALVQRTPEGGPVARWIWHRGAWLLTAAMAVQSGPAVLALARGQWSHAELLESPWVLLVSAGVALYLFRSPRVRDAFADFPPREGEAREPVAQRPR